MSLEHGRFLRSHKAAKRIDLSESYLAHLRVRGDGPPFCKVGKVVLYDIHDLDAWVTSRKRHNTCDESDGT